MTFALYTNTVSPHQLPLARELIGQLGVDNYRYVYTTPLTKERTAMGWRAVDENWILTSSSVEAQERLRDSDVVLMQHNRDWEMLKGRLCRGKACIYASERWFKPRLGMLRMLWPKYLRMALQFVCMLRKSKGLFYFPIGIHAACDMARLCGVFSGDLRCLFKAPALDFESKPGGRIWLKNGGDGKRYCLDKMRMWGYFVEPSQLPNSLTSNSSTLKVLWVGRLLKLKRVDTIIRAVVELFKSQSPSNLNSNSNFHVQLDIYGTGPEEKSLRRLAAKYGEAIKFYQPVPIAHVRRLMQEHDVYVLSSNGYEGWGAVVSEALEERMCVIGTYEAGSSATLLPKECLFKAGDWRSLEKLLSNAANLPILVDQQWFVQNACRTLQEVFK